MTQKSYTLPLRQRPPHRLLAASLGIGVIALALLLTGCALDLQPPDQTQFESLDALAELDEPVARLYVTPAKMLSFFISHAWFAVKLPGEHTFERWEVSLYKEGPYDYVRKDAHPPDEYTAAGEIYVWAELIGDDALSVVEFVHEESPNYPYRDIYMYVGANCNTYVQWVIDQTGWDVELPPAAYGADYADTLLPDASPEP